MLAPDFEPAGLIKKFGQHFCGEWRKTYSADCQRSEVKKLARLRYAAPLRCLHPAPFLAGVMVLVSLPSEGHGQTSNLPTVDSHLLQDMRISRAVVTAESICPTSPPTTFSFLRGEADCIYESPSLSSGSFEGVPWYFVNGYLYYHYPTNELPLNCSVAMWQIAYVENLGFAGIDRSKPVTRGARPGTVVAQHVPIKPGLPELELEFEYKAELVVSGTLRLITNSTPEMRVSYEYHSNFYGGAFPVAFTVDYLNYNVTSKWTFVELELTNRSFHAEQLNPMVLLCPRGVLVESNGVTYVLENHKLERMMTYKEVQASKPFLQRVLDFLRAFLWR